MSEIRGEKATEVFEDGKVVFKQVLDHGFVRFVESYGSDESIIEAARMSTQKGFEGWGPRFKCKKCNRVVPREETYDAEGGGKGHGGCWGEVLRVEEPGDEKLLAYLWKNRHTTPFEMAGAIIEVQAPIFVFREWHRHRTQSYNEMSARYAPLPAVDYIPTLGSMLGKDAENKQAGTVREASVFTEADYPEFVEDTKQLDGLIQAYYEKWLTRGVRKEQARIRLPVGRYSRMRAHANLLNWMRFLSLRHHAAAQFEIRAFAEVVFEMLSERFPRTLSLFNEGTQEIRRV